MMKKQNKGFTLMEVLIYTAIIGITGTILSGTLLNATKIKGRETASIEVNNQLNFVLQNIQRSIMDSSVIDITPAVSTSTLVLQYKTEANNPTKFYITDGVVYKKVGSGDAQPLTNENVVADAVNFLKISGFTGHDTVQIDLSLHYNTSSPDFSFSRTLSSAIARVSAATFDSNLIPGADNFYDIGQTSAKWKDMSLSGNLSVSQNAYLATGSGNVGIGTISPLSALDIFPSAGLGTQAMGIHIKGGGTHGSITDAGAMNIWNTGGVSNYITFGDGSGYDLHFGKASDSGTTKFLTIRDSGNVGIGTTTPSQTLDVTSGDWGGITMTSNADGIHQAFMIRQNEGSIPFGIFTSDAGGTSIYSYGNGTLNIGQNRLGVNYNMGYKLNTAEAALTVRQVGSSPILNVFTSASTSPALFVANTTGNVGIGTTTPGSKLTIGGTAGVDGLRFPDGTTQTTAGGGTTVLVPTRQIFTSGSGTYTTPAGAGKLIIRMVGGGGGVGAATGTNGEATTFNSISAAGGSGSSSANCGGGGVNWGGLGGTGGSGAASFRSPGQPGDWCSYLNVSVGGNGGGTMLSSGPAWISSTVGVSAAANTGAGAAGCYAAGATACAGAGGGEYVELIINNPASTYTYTVGAGGTGTNYCAANGGSGVIIVEEIYATSYSTDITSGGNNTFTGANTFSNTVTVSNMLISSCPAGFQQLSSQNHSFGCFQTAQYASTPTLYDAIDYCYTTYGGHIPSLAELHLLKTKGVNVTHSVIRYEWVDSGATQGYVDLYDWNTDTYTMGNPLDTGYASRCVIGF